MRRLYGFLIATAVFLLPAVTLAADAKCSEIPVTVSGAAATDVDISGGAVTTDQFPAVQTSFSAQPRFNYLMLGLDVTDANNSVTNLRATFTASETNAGTFRAIPLCTDAAPVLTCDAVKVDWDPTSGGKNWWIKPIDWAYLFGKITLTPTGHGAGDKVTVSLWGCRE